MGLTLSLSPVDDGRLESSLARTETAYLTKGGKEGVAGAAPFEAYADGADGG